MNILPAYSSLKPRTTQIRKRRKPRKTSTRYELLLAGGVRKYPCGREVCQGNKAGQTEYRWRITQMVDRQNGVCCLVPHVITGKPTFEHFAGRGFGGFKQDDRIVDDAGKPMNGAACAEHNLEKGSMSMEQWRAYRKSKGLPYL